MEHLINNEPSTLDSSDQTIHIYSNTKKEPEPKPESEPIIDPEEINDLVMKFEEEANECLHYVMQESIKCVNPTQTGPTLSEFRRWMNSCSWELKELNYKAVEKRFHNKLSGGIKSLVEMFTPKPPPSHKVGVMVEDEAKVETKSPPTPPP